MELNKRLGGEEPDKPQFFDIDAEIRKLVESVNGHADLVHTIETEHWHKHNEITAKIQKLREQLDIMHKAKYEDLRKARDQHDEDLSKLAALRRQKEEEAKNAAYETTVQLIKEICADFASWHMAREYQVEDVVRIVHQYTIGSTGVMNANDMALGKTFESLVALYICIEIHKQKHNGAEPTILWLTKKSIVETGGTFNEARRWFPDLKCFPVRGADNAASKDMVFEFAEMGGMCVITNYETVKNTPRAQKIHWDFVIMDEVHKLRGGANASGPTAIWEATKNLSRGFVLMLTGTPVANRIEEIWSYLHIFDPILFDNARKFARQFQAFKDVSGEFKMTLQSERVLKEILKGRLIRRTATEVGLQMPPVNYQTVVLQHNEQQAALYKDMLEKFFVFVDKQDPDKLLPAMSLLAQLTRLRQINVLPVCTFVDKDEEGNEIGRVTLDVRDSSKLDECLDRIVQTDDQAIVFCSFNEPLEELAMRLQIEGLSSAIISSKYADKMSTYETDFQAGKIHVLLLNSAMGEGLNLHKDKAKWLGGARAVHMLDKWWNDARNNQCIARAVRPGETAGEPVFVYDYKVENSVDYFIQFLCDEKSQKLGNLTEASELRPASEWKRLLKELL